MQLIEFLVKQLRTAANHNAALQHPPAAILWTDEAKQWQSAMPVIKQFLPELVELGPYNLAERTGPAIWLKCAIAGVLDDVNIPTGLTPIVYLPGVCRKDLRAIEICPEHLKPLAELQYRGSWWAYNSAGRDWSVSSFLTNANVGVALEVAKDQATQDALLAVLSEVLEAQVESLQGKRLEAADFHALVMADPIKDLLAWLNDPQEKQRQLTTAKWPVFVSLCQQQFDFTPEMAQLPQALQKLCDSQGPWQAVWQRFYDTAHNLPKLVHQLATIYPLDLAAPVENFVSVNKTEEQELEIALAALATQMPDVVRSQIAVLHQQHHARLQWVWARLGLSPWVQVLAKLQQVAELTKVELSGFSPDAMAEHYAQTYWQADAAALAAMQLAKEPHQQDIVAKVLAVIYTPWLAAVAQNFQQLVQSQGYPGQQGVKDAIASYQVKSQVVFFVDGLRFDVAKRLTSLLAERGVGAALKTSWSALPSLTATAKAAVTPVAAFLSGKQDNTSFIPSLADSDIDFSSYQFKKALQQQGWQYLDGLETGDPSGLAWLQLGDIDTLGHDMQQKLPLHIDPVLQEICGRVQGLLDAGWHHIRIVTDHGWLWSPVKLPADNIPEHMVKKRLARCAILKDNVDVPYFKAQWHWNPNVTLVMARGINVFVAGDYYNHGGLTLQECLTPVLEISK